jgi:hypothetical protein
MTPDVAKRLQLKRLQTARMAWGLGAYGICVDEGDERRLPAVEWFPDDARSLLRLAADTGHLTQDDRDALRRIADGVPAGDAYRIESRPDLYRLRKDLRNCSLQEFMARFYEDIAQSVSIGMSEKVARKAWFDAAAEEACSWSPRRGALEKSAAQSKYDRRRKADAAKVWRYENTHGRKNLRDLLPT